MGYHLQTRKKTFYHGIKDLSQSPFYLFSFISHHAQSFTLFSLKSFAKIQLALPRILSSLVLLLEVLPELLRFRLNIPSNPLQYSRLENPMDRGAWWATVHGVAKSRTRLSDFPF